MSILFPLRSPLRLLGAVASVLILAATAACAGGPPPAQSPHEEPCALLACAEGLHVDLTPASGRWSPGAYVFTIDTPEGSTVCEGALPLRPCADGASLRCKGPSVRLAESGCALPAAEQGFPGVEIVSGPASVEITVAHDGAPIAHGSFTPSYRTVTPNGPRCGPSCRQASEVLTW